MEIVQYKNKGIKIDGDEVKLRYCISEYLNIRNIGVFHQKIFANINLLSLDKIIKNFE